MTLRDAALTWIDTLHRATRDTIVTTKEGCITLDEGVHKLIRLMRPANTFLIGNGGSLAAAQHLATDFALGGLKAMALSDPVALTSHANDFGVESTFEKYLEGLPFHANDVLIAMSCSGKSKNIIDAARFAEASGLAVITLTGFEPDNPLRSFPGSALDFYVPTHQYGFVQLAHEAILHAASDIVLWKVPPQ